MTKCSFHDNDTCGVEFTHSTSPSHEPSSSQDPSFLFFDFFLLFISSGCYFR